MIRALVALLALTAALPAATSGWTYAALVAYEDEYATAVLSPALAGDDWRLVDPVEGATLVARDGTLTLSSPVRGNARLSVRAGDGRTCALRFLRPGEARGLTIDAEGQPQVDGVRAVLVLSRLEARADRRWEVLRDSIDRAAKPCAQALAAPVVAEGLPALIAQARDAQALDVRGQGVLLELSPDDRLAAWKHREYRQCLAWLVADLQARGAAHIALVPPVAARPRDGDLAPLRRQVADVAVAYRCRLVEGVDELSDPRWWEVAPGVLGTTLNPAGVERRSVLLAPWRVH